MTRFVAVLVVAGVVSVGAYQGAPAGAPAVMVERGVMVSMRDGVKLWTDIYRPATNGTPVSERLPVLLQRTPYEIEGRELVRQANYFAEHGYVVALQSIRGRYKSGGEFMKYDPKGMNDAFDTIAWLAALPYSDGQVGMWGTSYGAHTQAEAAKAKPPALKALLINEGGLSNAWDNAVRHGGAFELGRELTWAWGEIAADATDPVVRKYIDSEKVTDWYAAFPFREGLSPLAINPEYEKYIRDEMTKSDYGEYWQGPGMNWQEYYEQSSDIPMMHVGGWYDIWLRTTTDNYRYLSTMKKSPIRMMIGPWNHGGNARTSTGEVDFGESSAIAEFNTAFQLRYFDHLLKGKPTGAENDAPVRLFVMGTGDGHRTGAGKLFHGGYWRDSKEWPLPDAKVTPYYFHDDGGLTPKAPAASERRSTTYVFDPKNPVPTIGGSVSGRLNDGAWDQRERPEFFGSKAPYLPLRSRQDVVVFQTPPLTEDVTVVGPITVKLFVSSTATDTDFTAKLVDVYPPSADFPRGFDMNITDGIIRARYRGGRLKQELIVPGQVYEMSVRPFPTANVFKKGHRIRVDISSSNFPRFDVNPNTGEPLGQNRRSITANNTVWHSAVRPSQILLPIVPNAH
ncbi:MAG: CocE/NonD family hydrolase [Vicinamibacterales bacterium]